MSLNTTSPWPYFEDDEVEAVNRVLRSGKVNYWTGDEGRLFEREFGVYCGSSHAIALANGTVALELALDALSIGTGDEVIVPSRTFIASASAVVMRGATPVMADVDFESQNITAESIKKVLTNKTKAVIVVHLNGWPCDMDSILDLAKEHNLKIVEDCAQAVGSKYKGKPIGSFGDVAAFSFCQDKIMTTGGEGGMLVTKSHELWEKAWAFKDHGKSYDAVYNKAHSPGFRWLHESFGTNWRMTEMQAAIGRVVLKKVDRWVKQRREFAAVLTNCFSKLKVARITIPPEDIYHAYYKYYVFVNEDKLKKGWNRDNLMNEITAKGIPCYSGICSEIYLEKAFDHFEINEGTSHPIAKTLGETSLMFLVHPTLTLEDINKVCQVVEDIFQFAQL